MPDMLLQHKESLLAHYTLSNHPYFRQSWWYKILSAAMLAVDRHVAVLELNIEHRINDVQGGPKK